MLLDGVSVLTERNDAAFHGVPLAHAARFSLTLTLTLTLISTTPHTPSCSTVSVKGKGQNALSAKLSQRGRQRAPPGRVRWLHRICLSTAALLFCTPLPSLSLTSVVPPAKLFGRARGARRPCHRGGPDGQHDQRVRVRQSRAAAHAPHRPPFFSPSGGMTSPRTFSSDAPSVEQIVEAYKAAIEAAPAPRPAGTVA